MSDLTAAVEAAARAWFARQQSDRLDTGRNNPATGKRWTWDDLRPIDQHAYRALMLPIVTAVAEHVHCGCTDEHEATP